MILPSPKDAIHKAWLYRVLMGFADDSLIAKTLAFKGGTCAAMLGWLDRFSVDLDFDYAGEMEQMEEVLEHMEGVFDELGLTIKDASKHAPQYFLKYPAKEGDRNTLEIDVTFPPAKTNEYTLLRFSEIDRILCVQTKETMVANKLVALQDRYQKTGAIAGRDIYDINFFLLRGFRYNREVIKERSGKDAIQFFEDLIKFVEEYITEQILTQDLNTLLPFDRFRQIRKTLKRETLMLLQDELQRLRGHAFARGYGGRGR